MQTQALGATLGAELSGGGSAEPLVVEAAEDPQQRNLYMKEEVDLEGRDYGLERSFIPTETPQKEGHHAEDGPSFFSPDAMTNWPQDDTQHLRMMNKREIRLAFKHMMSKSYPCLCVKTVVDGVLVIEPKGTAILLRYDPLTGHGVILTAFHVYDVSRLRSAPLFSDCGKITILTFEYDER